MIKLFTKSSQYEVYVSGYKILYIVVDYFRFEL